jgi:hypothetical protein
MEMWLVAALLMPSAIALLLRGAAADAGAGDDGALLAHGLRELEASLRHGFLGRDHPELGEAIHEGDVLGREVLLRVEALDVGGVLEADLFEVRRVHSTDAAAAGDEALPEAVPREP